MVSLTTLVAFHRCMECAESGQPAQRQSRWIYTWGALAKEMGGGHCVSTDKTVSAMQRSWLSRIASGKEEGGAMFSLLITINVLRWLLERGFRGHMGQI